MSQGYHEAPDHVRNTLKSKGNDISNSEIVPAVNFHKLYSKRKAKGYWNESIIRFEIESLINEIGFFPTTSDLNNMNRTDLLSAMKRNGSINHFRKLLGYNFPRRQNGYWSEENTIIELKKLIEELSHFPTGNELKKINRGDLQNAINQHGGFNYFRKLLKHEIIQNSKGHWTDETIIAELKLIVKKLNYFPTLHELRIMNKNSLGYAVSHQGGVNYFKEKMGYKITKKTTGHWNENNIINELKLIISDKEHFPTGNELTKMKRGDLLGAINQHGGFNHFRERIGYKSIHKPDNYWNEETIIIELESVIYDIDYFPSQEQLIKMKRGDLKDSIVQHGGANYFRKKLGYKPLQEHKGYWSEKTIIEELRQVIKHLGHFPSHNELNITKKKGLQNAINKSDGLIHFREKMGYNTSVYQKYKSELSLYLSKRGRKSEQLIREIITEWSNIHGKPSPDFNVKLSKGNVIEFVCDFDKKVGIDVTNTKASKGSAYSTISRKWKHKQYHLHLDELWIVVFTDVLSLEDYIKLNIKSPDDVKVFSIDDFLKELDFSTELCNTKKISKFNNCTFHNKNEMININEPV